MQNLAESSIQNEDDNLDSSIVSTGTSHLELTVAQETHQASSDSNTWKHLLRVKLKRKIDNEIAEEEENYKLDCAKDELADLESELKILQEEYSNYCERTKQESLKAIYLSKNFIKCESYLTLFEEDLTKIKIIVTGFPKEVQEKHNLYLKQNELYKTQVTKLMVQIKNTSNLLKEIKFTKTDNENKYKESEQKLLEELNEILQQMQILQENLKTLSQNHEECKLKHANLDEELKQNENRQTILVAQLQGAKVNQEDVRLSIDRLGNEHNNIVSQLKSKHEEENNRLLALQENLQILNEQKNALLENVNIEQVVVHRSENEIKEITERLKSLMNTKLDQENKLKSSKELHNRCLTELNATHEKNSSMLNCQQIRNEARAEECVQVSKILDELESNNTKKEIKLKEIETENSLLRTELQQNHDKNMEKEIVLKNMRSDCETSNQKSNEDLNEYNIVKNKLEKMRNDKNLKHDKLQKEHQNRLKNLFPLHANNEKLEETRSNLEQKKLFLLKEISEKEQTLKEEEAKRKVVGILKSPGNRASIPSASKSVTFRNSISWASDSYDALLEELTRSSNDTISGNKVQPHSSPPTKLSSKQKCSSSKTKTK